MEPEGSWTGPGFSSESWPYIWDSQLHFTGLSIPLSIWAVVMIEKARDAVEWPWRALPGLAHLERWAEILLLPGFPWPCCSSIAPLTLEPSWTLGMAQSRGVQQEWSALLALWVRAVFWLNFAFPPVHLRYLADVSQLVERWSPYAKGSLLFASRLVLMWSTCAHLWGE